MKPTVWMLVPLAALACAAGGDPAGGGGRRDAPATRLEWDSRSFEPGQIRVLESDPPKFVLVFSREMPTPGYRLKVDAVEVDGQAGRIVAKISEVAPSGMVAQVITRTELAIEVGTLAAGRYVVELKTRKGEQGDYRPAGAAVVVASGRAKPQR